MAWWKEISTDQILALRRRLLQYLDAEFGSTLKTELEDVTQHAFSVLFQRRNRVSTERDGLFRYLKTVARRSAIDRRRVSASRRKPRKKSTATTAGRASSSTSPITPPAQRLEENEKIWQVFCALDDLDRLVIWSHIVDEKSIREVCRELDLNWHRVSAIVEAALREFRNRLES